MKLHTESTAHLNTITAYGDDYLEVNRQRFEHAICFQPTGDIQHWPITQFDDITAESLNAGREPRPEIIIIGTGKQQRFLHPRVLQTVYAQGIGVEVMNTQAAARTYNILMAESRQVLALLLPPSFS